MEPNDIRNVERGNLPTGYDKHGSCIHARVLEDGICDICGEPSTPPHNRISKRTGGNMKLTEKQNAPYGVTEPGAPLTDKEWNPIAQIIRQWERDHRTPFIAIMDAINAVLAKRENAQPVADAPPADGDMVDQMLVCIYGPKCGVWEPELRRRMAEAARIPLDRMRGPVTKEERELWAITPGVCPSIIAVIEYRIDRILRPKKQTPVEMVTELIDAYRGGVAAELAAEIVAALKEENHAE